MENSKRSFIVEMFWHNLPWIGIFFAIQIGLWAMGLNLFKALTAQAESVSVTTWCWIFLVGWIVYFCLIWNKLHLERKLKTKKALQEQKEAKDKAEKEDKIAKDQAEKKLKKAKDHQDQIKFRNETALKLSSLTENQAEEFKSLNSQIEAIQKTQVSIKKQIKTNQASVTDQIEKDLTSQLKQLNDTIDAVKDKLDATHSKICSDNYSNQFPSQSIRRAGCYSSKSL